jgi:hypothetical protein
MRPHATRLFFSRYVILSAAKDLSCWRAKFFAPLGMTLFVLSLCVAARAERPSAMKLFPEESVVFIRITNANDLGQKMQQTSFGRMFKDPQLQPFIENLYGKASELYASEAEGKLGLSWDDLKKLPKGEVAFAVVARPEKRPALLLLVDQGDEATVADKLVDKVLDIAQEKGGEFSTEKIGDVEVTVVRDRDRENRMFGVCQRENTIIVATDPNVIRGVLWHWDNPGKEDGGDVASTGEPKSIAEATAEPKKDGDAATASDDESKKEAAEFVPGRTLSQNERFATILKSCRRPQDPPANVAFYVDPIELARNAGRGNTGLQFALGLFPALGIDGLMAAGGGVTYATDEYDNLSQFHLLLENPRAGVMLLPAFQAGDIAPQPFVPMAVETYIAWNYNTRATYDRLIELIETYRPKGSTAKFIQDKISDKLGIDFPTKVIDNLKGRFTWFIAYERPSRFRGQHHVVAAELADEASATESLKTVMDKFPELFEERQFGNVTYYAMMPKGLKDMPEEERPATPFVGIMDGYFFIGTSCPGFEKCIAARDGTTERLTDSADYARTSAVIGRETTGTTPVMFSMSRMEESLRQWYDLLTSEKTRALIDENKEDNKFLQALADAMEQDKLPPFDVLLPYMSPGGGILYDTDTGYHGISFQLRSESQPVEPPPAEAK